MLVFRVTGHEKVLEELRELMKRVGPEGRQKVLSAIGHRVALSHMPTSIRENRAGWPKPSGRARAYRAGGNPLVDTARLVNSWAWSATAGNVRIWTAVRYARVLDKGGAIRPKRGRFLLIPLSPPLKMTEARGFPAGKAAIRARYPKSFFLLKGPEGPGIYRESRQRIGTKVFSMRKGQRQRVASPSAIYSRKKGRFIERIAAARRQVVIRPYGFGAWRSEWMPDLISVTRTFIGTGQVPSASSSGGSPDRGPKGGQLS